MTLEPSLASLVVTLGLRGAQKRALEGPVFRSVSGLERLKHGTADAEMIRSGCICVPDTHAEVLDDSGTLLVFVGGDYGLERGSKKGAGGPHFEVFERLGEAETWHCGHRDDSKRLYLRPRYTYRGPR